MTIWALALLTSLITTGCGYGAFTQAMRQSYGMDDARLREVQFFMSHRCVLERTVNESTGEVARGRLEIRSGVAIDVVRIPKRTPGVLEFALPDQLAVSFAPGSRFFFGPDPRAGPGAPYSLLGKYDRVSHRFLVLHGGAEYALVSKKPCQLVVHRRETRSRSRDRTTLPGRRLGE
ncbi:MAG: hypothetical protein JW751_30940 [Polyangiaceae bacterium]|nr:hypothetical protein [Polyangiaceae bacterium]